MAIPAMALLQLHDDRRDIVTEPVARRHAAIEARRHSELRNIRNWGRNRAVKTLWLVLLSFSFILISVYSLMIQLAKYYRFIRSIMLYDKL